MCFVAPARVCACVGVYAYETASQRVYKYDMEHDARTLCICVNVSSCVYMRESDVAASRRTSVFLIKCNRECSTCCTEMR